MKYPSPFIGPFAATAVLSLPLNINMGAYSPALVVGDGAIGFEGQAGANQVASLMNTLQGATANGAIPAPGGAQPAAPAEQPAPAAPAAESITTDALPQGMGKIVNVRADEFEGLTPEEQEALEEAQEEAAITDNTKRAVEEFEGLTPEEQEALEEAQEEAAITDNTKRDEFEGLTAEQIEALEEAEEEAAITDNTKRDEFEGLTDEEIEALEEAEEEAAITDNTKRDLTAEEEEELDEEIDFEDNAKRGI
ncbi:hypothetical protein ONS96_006747 [Cadophora gregata f. sp. sojae]|nr:hypothetical protein ONS96_006747 [Cadophora gregata f. sp. sojae]